MSFIFALLISVSVMLCAWCFYVYTKNPGVVDVFWGIAICCVGTFYLHALPTEAWLFIPQALLFLWAIRLSLFLLVTRVAKGKTEERYKKISCNWKNESRGFLYHFLLQAILAWVIGLPFYFISTCTEFNVLQYAAVLMVIAGILGETVADFTLYRFAQKKTGDVCQVGVWRYSRHPNYFFECLIWLGFSLMGITSAHALLSLLSIATIFCVMWFITIPMTERQSVERRGERYIAYQKHVSCFFPWFRQ